MIGRSVERQEDEDQINERKISDEKIALELRNFQVDMPGEMVKGIDVRIREGEIFGFGGLAGQGKIGIINGIMGLFETRGDIIVHGKNSISANWARHCATISPLCRKIDEGSDCFWANRFSSTSYFQQFK